MNDHDEIYSSIPLFHQILYANELTLRHAALDRLELYSEESMMKMQDDLKKKEGEYREAKRKRQRALSFEERQQARRADGALQCRCGQLTC